MANATGAEKFAAELVEGNQRETRAHEDERIHLGIARCAAEPIAFYRCQREPGTRGLSSYGIEIGFSRYGRLWRAGQPLAGNNRATLGPGQPGRRLHDVHEIFGDLRPSARLIPLAVDAEIRVEYGDENFFQSTYHVRSVTRDQNMTRVLLAPPQTTCKARDRRIPASSATDLQPCCAPATESCCAP